MQLVLRLLIPQIQEFPEKNHVLLEMFLQLGTLISPVAAVIILITSGSSDLIPEIINCQSDLNLKTDLICATFSESLNHNLYSFALKILKSHESVLIFESR